MTGILLRHSGVLFEANIWGIIRYSVVKSLEKNYEGQLLLLASGLWYISAFAPLRSETPSELLLSSHLLRHED